MYWLISWRYGRLLSCLIASISAIIKKMTDLCFVPFLLFSDNVNFFVSSHGHMPRSGHLYFFLITALYALSVSLSPKMDWPYFDPHFLISYINNDYWCMDRLFYVWKHFYCLKAALCNVCVPKLKKSYDFSNYFFVLVCLRIIIHSPESTWYITRSCLCLHLTYFKSIF